MERPNTARKSVRVTGTPRVGKTRDGSLFADAKAWPDLRRFRLRGLEKVNGEALPIAAGQNLKRWLAARGWGRRNAPCGSLLALPRELGRLSAVSG